MIEKNDVRQKELEIDLQKLLFVYLKKWWLILLCGIVLAGGALLYTVKAVTPLYRASVTIYVNNVKSNQSLDSITGSNLSASQQLVNTYVNIIKSDRVLEMVLRELNDPELTLKGIREMMTAAQVDSTEIFAINIDHPDPEKAAKIANTLATIGPDAISDLVEGSSARVIDFAKIPAERHSPSYSRNTLLGGMIGCLLAVVYVTLHYLLDVRLKTEEDLTQLFDIPVLGQIPAFSQQNKKRSGYGSAAPAASEQQGEVERHAI